MNDINKIVIIGRLTKDPEMKYTTNGTATCKFSIAVNESYKKGEVWENYVNFFDIVTWVGLAESCNKNLKKGLQVAIEGKLKQSRWVNQTDNKPQSKIEIIADSVQYLFSMAKNDGSNPFAVNQANQVNETFNVNPWNTNQ
jgi:single-strand DNA-binding protein